MCSVRIIIARIYKNQQKQEELVKKPKVAKEKPLEGDERKEEGEKPVKQKKNIFQKSRVVNKLFSKFKQTI